jgi:hypothetical protein
MNIPNKPKDFFQWLKSESENYWQTIEINSGIYGFQIRQETKWLPGLSENEIVGYEKELGFQFPEIYKEFLRCMNGIDKLTVNIYGESGEEYQYAPGYYAFPRDLEAVVEQIMWVYDSCDITKEKIEEQQIPHIIPVVAHRCLIADRCDSNPVLSMYGSDIIPYSPDLQRFLVDDIFRSHVQDESSYDAKVKFWLNQ